MHLDELSIGVRKLRERARELNRSVNARLFEKLNEPLADSLAVGYKVYANICGQIATVVRVLCLVSHAIVSVQLGVPIADDVIGQRWGHSTQLLKHLQDHQKSPRWMSEAQKGSICKGSPHAISRLRVILRSSFQKG